VCLGQHRLAELTARERAIAIGYLPQAGEVAWNVTVETLVRLGRLPHRTPARVDAAATMAALDALDLNALAAREVGTLSAANAPARCWPACSPGSRAGSWPMNRWPRSIWRTSRRCSPISAGWRGRAWAWWWWFTIWRWR
jgi:hypothetical protein